MYVQNFLLVYESTFSNVAYKNYPQFGKNIIKYQRVVFMKHPVH